MSKGHQQGVTFLKSTKLRSCSSKHKSSPVAGDLVTVLFIPSPPKIVECEYVQVIVEADGAVEAVLLAIKEYGK